VRLDLFVKLKTNLAPLQYYPFAFLNA